MRIGYVRYGSQSEVTASVARELVARGHGVQHVDATGPLELCDPRTGLPRPTPAVLANLALSALQFGRRALFHRWNTPLAFDVHSRTAGRRLAALPQRPDLLLQNGAIEQMPGLFARTTVFTLPTLREPFGIAFLDAMGCGVACVGTDIEAIPEIVADGQTGLLVPPKDEIALSDALLALLADPPRRRRMGAVGRRDGGAPLPLVARRRAVGCPAARCGAQPCRVALQPGCR